MIRPASATRSCLLLGWILLFVPVGRAQSGPEPAAHADFHHARWGMSLDQVRAGEAAPPTEERDAADEHLLIYKGADALAVYSFVQGKLVRARRIFTAEHPTDVNQFIADFRAEEAHLVDAHGLPQQDRAVWIDDSLQEERIAYLEQDRARATSILTSDRFAGVAVSLGQLKLYAEWCGERTEVVHSLTGADSHVTHLVEYRSVAQPVDPACAADIR